MLNVLIVDDELKVCQLIQKLVPWEEIAVIESDEIDIVLTDIRMPGMDGIELIRHAKKSYPSISFIIISGHRDFEYAQSALKFGASDYLLKPIGKEDLKKTLTNVIENKAASTNRKLHEAGLEEELKKKTALINESWFEQQYRTGFDLTGESAVSIAKEYGVHLYPSSFRIIMGKMDVSEKEDIEKELSKTLMDKIAAVFDESFSSLSNKEHLHHRQRQSDWPRQ